MLFNESAHQKSTGQNPVLSFITLSVVMVSQGDYIMPPVIDKFSYFT